MQKIEDDLGTQKRCHNRQTHYQFTTNQYRKSVMLYDTVGKQLARSDSLSTSISGFRPVHSLTLSSFSFSSSTPVWSESNSSSLFSPPFLSNFYLLSLLSYPSPPPFLASRQFSGEILETGLQVKRSC